MNLFTFFKSAIILYKELDFQKKYVNAHIKPYLKSLELKHDGKFTDYQRIKILNYYCLFVPCINCVSYKKLCEQIFTIQDRKLATLMGLFTPIYDDLFDDLHLEPSQIQKLTIDPVSYEADIFMTKIAKEIGLHLIDTAVDKTAYLQILEKLFTIQVNTLDQFNPNTSNEALQRITWDKGMISFVYYYTHSFGNPTDEMRDVLFEIGGLYQLCNDIFDMYKDCQEKSYTLANTCKDFTALKVFFLERVTLMNQKIKALPFRKNEKAYFCLVMQSIIGRGLIAINYFILLEKKKGKNINWFDVERKELVIDMEKPINMVKWFYHTWKLTGLG